MLGITDSQGMIELKREQAPVVMLLVRSDGRLLAKVPVVPGAAAMVEIPIADDTARLQAQARLVEIREQLVDLVARRNILLARARAQLNQGQLDQAQQLLEELDALPGRRSSTRSYPRPRTSPSTSPKTRVSRPGSQRCLPACALTSGKVAGYSSAA